MDCDDCTKAATEYAWGGCRKDCPGCREAETNPATHVRYLGCKSCEARSLATWQEFADASKAKAITPEYKRHLVTIFGAGWEEGHKEVKRWAEKIAADKN